MPKATSQQGALKKYLDWLNEHPRIVKQNPDGSDYVPISCVQEDLMEGFFGHTKMELLRETILSHGLSGVGRLHYKHPVTGEWLYQDGSASIPFVMGMRLDFPRLGSMILLNCAKKIGNRFGQKLNRDQDDSPIEGDMEIENNSLYKGKKKPDAVELIPDMDMQKKYNAAVEFSDEIIMKTLRAIYPSIKYTGTQKINNAEN
jgi:hypothetical protein